MQGLVTRPACVLVCVLNTWGKSRFCPAEKGWFGLMLGSPEDAVHYTHDPSFMVLLRCLF